MTKLPSPKPSPRMKYFVDNAINQLPFWDMCCDHGYIGIHALKSERFSEVHFVDQIPHIIERLKNLFIQSPHKKEHYRYFFYDCGGENLKEIISGNVIIAGVGGRTIVDILTSLDEKKLLAAKRLILSPHLDIDFLNTYLENKLRNKYKLISKNEIEENKRKRLIIILDLI